MGVIKYCERCVGYKTHVTSAWVQDQPNAYTCEACGKVTYEKLTLKT